ncbi:mannitol dehydrogenase family protein [Saccharospirillum mangrovi]|uniref:mannitol dehydrogenase family protein n=1 Tax=Saccharospirillum mangrovi TaxID=2161747 RepID=UPI000D3B5B00|nr:mannitol dehydrogenase family protein [Saccharospirillum mangrovi]
MSRSSQALADVTAATCPEGLGWPSYDRQLTTGIVHIGVGGFHRAHQARYLDDYLAAGGESHWGICGVGLMPGDAKLFQALEQQGGLYSLTEKDDQQRTDRVIGSLHRLIFAPENPQAAIEAMADPAVKIISMTITEGGYRYDFDKDRFFSEHPDIQHDLANPQAPKTVFGYLWQAAKSRSALGDAGRVTLMSCDNVPHNGNVLRKAMLAFIELADPALKPWFEQSASYPNSMVDRITPAPEPADAERIASHYGVIDPCALGCETFIQWVIEDDFIAGRPALENVGVEFTDDVSPYEMTKLRLLNGSHLMMGFVGYLAGYERVDLAIKDPAIAKLVRQYMERDAEPTLAREVMPFRAYEDTLIERFGNSQIGDQQVRICSDGYAKLKNYVMPVVRDAQAQGLAVHRLAFLFATFLAYLNGVADDGRPLRIIEFNLSEADNRASRDNRLSLLKTEALFGVQPNEQDQAFLALVEHWYQRVVADGGYTALLALLDEN